MENPLRKQIRSIMKDHKKRQMWYRIVTTLAVVVVFVTTYMLILPAITMESRVRYYRAQTRRKLLQLAL